MDLKGIHVDWKRLLITTGIVLFSAIVVGTTTWYVMDRSAKDTKEASDKSVLELQKRISKLEESGDTPTSTEKTGDELLSIDSSFNRYINHDMGFQIDIPKQAYYSLGSCTYTTAEGDHSYRPVEAAVPTKVIVEGGVAYITSEYFYRLTGETRENNKSYFSGCEKIVTTIAELANKDTFETSQWKINVKTAATDAAVDTIIKQAYGSGCAIGAKTATTDTGTVSITISGDGLDLDTTKCPINYMTALFYNESKGKFAYWNLGQASSFYKQGMTDGYDTGMKDSFKFL
jgi:hypothetical protein